MKTNSHTKCLICDYEDFKSLKRYHNHHLVKCKSCGFVFAKKIPTIDELTDYYNKYPTDIYLSPITIKRFNELLDEFEAYRKTNKLLDVGCGNGYFLVTAKKRGWKVFGTEFTDEAVSICESKGISVKKGIFTADDYIRESFDIITSFEVIEHLNNPKDVVENIKKILRKGGLFYFTTPNFTSFSRNIFKENWIMIDYPEHLSYYTPRTIRFLLEQHGLKQKRILTTGIRSRNIPIDNIIAPDSGDERIRQITERHKLFGLIKQFLNCFLSIIKKGDTIKGYFVKLT